MVNQLVPVSEPVSVRSDILTSVSVASDSLMTFRHGSLGAKHEDSSGTGFKTNTVALRC